MQIRAESGKSALPICNYSQILYQFLTFTQNLKRSRLFPILIFSKFQFFLISFVNLLSCFHVKPSPILFFYFPNITCKNHIQNLQQL